MANYRPERVGELLRKTLGEIILRDFEFPESMVTVTDIVVNKKLESAKVFISVMPSEDSDKVIKELAKERDNIRWKMLKRLRLRAIPRLRFIADHGSEKSSAVEKILLNIEKENANKD